MQASARAGEKPTEITKLGPGDFFGETGLLEGRGTRNSSVICTTPVEVLMIDNAMVSRDRRGCQGCQGVFLPHGHAALMPPPSSQPTSFSAAPSPAAPLLRCSPTAPLLRRTPASPQPCFAAALLRCSPASPPRKRHMLTSLKTVCDRKVLPSKCFYS